MRFIRVVNFAKSQNLNDLAREKQYLQNYFFQTHLGKGMPTDICYTSALMMTGSAATLASQQVFDMRPTVLGDASMWAMQGMGQQLPASPQVDLSFLGAPQNGGGLPMPPQQQPAHPPPPAQLAPPLVQRDIDAAAERAVAAAAAANAGGTMCVYCGSRRHEVDKCTHMLAARKAFRNTQAAKADAAAAAGAAGAP